MSRKLSINYFSPQILQISQIFILSDRVELKKTSKTPLVMAEVYRPDVLSFRPVLKSELLHSPQVHHGFLQKLSPHSGKKHKKTLLTAVLDPRILLFYVFARRRGDFAEMMGVRGELGELAHQSSHPHRHQGTQCPPLRLVFFLFSSIR